MRWLRRINGVSLRVEAEASWVRRWCDGSCFATDSADPTGMCSGTESSRICSISESSRTCSISEAPCRRSFSSSPLLELGISSSFEVDDGDDDQKNSEGDHNCWENG